MNNCICTGWSSVFSWETLQQQPKLFKILFQSVSIIQRVRTVQACSKIISFLSISKMKCTRNKHACSVLTFRSRVLWWRDECSAVKTLFFFLSFFFFLFSSSFFSFFLSFSFILADSLCPRACKCLNGDRRRTKGYHWTFCRTQHFARLHPEDWNQTQAR